MTESILVPTDGSVESERALEIAVPIAKALDLTITLLTCWEGLPDLDETVSAQVTNEIETRELADRSARAAAIGELRIGPAGVRFRTESRTGAPVETILRHAEAEAPRFIAMSTHGRSGFKRWRLGSVTDQVLRHAEIDTVVVAPRADVSLREELGVVAVPLDGSDRSEAALAPALAIAAAAGSTLRLLRVAQIVVPTSPLGDDMSYGHVTEALYIAAQESLEAIASRIEQVPVETQVLRGEAVHALIGAAEDADVVVMSSRGRGGLPRLALGSVTDAVVRGSGKPVLVIRHAPA